ncbi:MAG: GIY-YIG nuclease family protein [Paludibacteraceae bacterium]|nr:GIY-YIG nuclease family protein [Paludibacteraceae bacterium]
MGRKRKDNTGGITKTYSCIICGIKVKNSAQLISHALQSHQLDFIQYTLKRLGLTEIPKCPICGKDCKFSYRAGGYFNPSCSKSCSQSLANRRAIANGTYHFLHQNAKLDENGKDIMRSKSQYTLSKEGKHRFLKANLIKDEKGRSVYHVRSAQDKAVLYVGIFKKENLLKIGKSTNLTSRLDNYKFAGIIFDKIYSYDGVYSDISKIESDIHKQLRCYSKPLNKESYPNNDFFRLGHSEWYDLKFKDAILKEIQKYFD